MGAPSTLAVEVHHHVPRCLLRLRDRADDAGWTGEAIELEMEFEHEARRWGVDPEISREDLAAMIDGSTVEVFAEEHRAEHAEDFRRWGRRGGLRTLALYGAPWFSLLALRRWEKVGPETLADHMTTMAGRS